MPVSLLQEMQLSVLLNTEKSFSVFDIVLFMGCQVEMLLQCNSLGSPVYIEIERI
jgi:hypothetical protein